MTVKPVTMKLAKSSSKPKLAPVEPKMKELFEYIKGANNKMVEKVLKANPKIDINQMRIKEGDLELTPFEYALTNKKAVGCAKLLLAKDTRVDLQKCIKLMMDSTNFEAQLFIKMID